MMEVDGYELQRNIEAYEDRIEELEESVEEFESNWQYAMDECSKLKEQLEIAQEFNDALNDELADCEASRER